MILKHGVNGDYVNANYVNVRNPAIPKLAMYRHTETMYRQNGTQRLCIDTQKYCIDTQNTKEALSDSS